MVETCVIPTLLYGAENWILDEGCLQLLERFQGEIGRRILKLTRYHSTLAVRIGLSLPSVTSRILLLKLSFLCHLLSSENESFATKAFKTIASQDVYDLSLVKQCIFLDSKLKTTCTAQILNDINCASSCLGVVKKAIASTDRRVLLEESRKHQSVSLASEINWLRVWEAARDKGAFWTNIAQTFYKLLTRPLFGERTCQLCDAPIQEDISFFSHLTQNHASRSMDIPKLMADLRLQDSEPDTTTFHCIKSLISIFHSTS